MAGDTVVFDLATSLLDVVIAYYGSQGIDLPARAYVSNGLEAMDCEQVTCHCLRVFPIGGDALTERARRIQGFTRRGAEFGLTIVRCVPIFDGQGRPPSAEAIESSARDILTDAETVTLAVIHGFQTGDLPKCGVGITGWAAYGPEGGYAGGTTTVAMELD